MSLNLKEIEARAPYNQWGDDVRALLGALRDTRRALANAHDAWVTFERKALESPSDEITITGALLKELRKGLSAVLGSVVDE